MNRRPAYVDAEFPGRCQNFPPPDAQGRESVLMPYQAKWVLDRSRIKLAEKSRQIGWSWSEAYKIVRDKSAENAKLDHWISSRDDIQARLFLEDCKAFAALLNLGAKDLGEQIIDEQKKISAYTLQFANGLRAHSMSSNPDAQAGKRGGRTLDEFALHPDPRKLYRIAYPGVTWGGGLSIFSTHRGSANYFNHLIVEARDKGNPKRVSLHRVTLQDALTQGFLYKLQKKLAASAPTLDELDPDTRLMLEMDEAAYFDFIRNGCPDEESFQEEYMCVPSDDEGAFLSFDLIDGCTLKGADDLVNDPSFLTTLPKGARCLVSPNWQWHAGDDCYLGLDIGRTKDLTVFWLDQKVAGISIARLVVELGNVPFHLQEAVQSEIHRRFQPRRSCIDASGLGRQFAERAIREFGEYLVEAMVFTPAVKEELAFPVRSAFQDKSTRVPNDKIIIGDFRQVRKETTASNNIRFTGERTKDGHADRFWAKALAQHAGKTNSGPVHFVAINPHASDRREHRTFGVGHGWGGVGVL